MVFLKVRGKMIAESYLVISSGFSTVQLLHLEQVGAVSTGMRCCWLQTAQ